jgi:peptidoglycan biosynthesis protein MviN/MurJ (putative lipid II flippase)
VIWLGFFGLIEYSDWSQGFIKQVVEPKVFWFLKDVAVSPTLFLIALVDWLGHWHGSLRNNHHFDASWAILLGVINSLLVAVLVQQSILVLARWKAKKRGRESNRQ